MFNAAIDIVPHKYSLQPNPCASSLETWRLSCSSVQVDPSKIRMSTWFIHFCCLNCVPHHDSKAALNNRGWQHLFGSIHLASEMEHCHELYQFGYGRTRQYCPHSLHWCRDHANLETMFEQSASFAAILKQWTGWREHPLENVRRVTTFLLRGAMGNETSRYTPVRQHQHLQQHLFIHQRTIEWMQTKQHKKHTLKHKK